MNRNELRNRLIKHLKKVLEEGKEKTQFTNLYSLVTDSLPDLPANDQNKYFSLIREIISEWISNGLLYPGLAGDPSSNLPWLTITEYGKQCIQGQNWLPYDPEGYLKELKKQIPLLDENTLTYMGESVATYNRDLLLSSTVTLGVASENLILILIESFIESIPDALKKERIKRKTQDKSLFAKYKIFLKEFKNYLNLLPKKLSLNVEIYLEGVFNFIRLNRNQAGHPTGKLFSKKMIYSNLQIFSEYAAKICVLTEYFRKNELK
mgnify:CR=1 FL=1